MNLAHIHIVLNHIPSIGTAVGLLLFIYSMVKKSDQLRKISLQLLVVMSLAVLPTYLTGNAAQSALRNRTDIPRGLIEVHQNAAIVTLILMTVTGTFAWFGLWQYRRFSRMGSGTTYAMLIISIFTAAAILRTANLGGDISHPEIRTAVEVPAPEVAWRAEVETFANNSWVWPASETLHFIGMALLFGIMMLVNLRMLGVMKSIPFKAVHRLLPLGILGFILNVISGMLFYIASPGMYYFNPGFTAKIVFLLVAAASVMYFTVFDTPWVMAENKDAPLSAKVVAVSGMVMLLGVMYFGRMLPFLRNN